MSDVVSLELLGHRINEMRAEMRTIRTSLDTLRQERVTDHDLRALVDRVAIFEAHVDTRLDQTERSFAERLDRIEALLQGRL